MIQRLSMPIRLRLTLWYLATLLVLLLIFISYFFTQAYFTLLKQTDNTLTLAASQALNDVVLEPTPLFINTLQLRQSMFEIDNNLTVRLVAEDGSPYQQISDASFAFIKLDDAEFTKLIEAEYSAIISGNIPFLPGTKEFSGPGNQPDPFYIEEAQVTDIDQDGLTARIHDGEWPVVNKFVDEVLIERRIDEVSPDASGIKVDMLKITKSASIHSFETITRTGGYPFPRSVTIGPNGEPFQAVPFPVQEAGIWYINSENAEALSLAEALPTVIPHAEFETVVQDGIRWRVYSKLVSNLAAEPVWLQVTQSLDLLDAFQQRMVTQLFWAIPLALLLAGLVGQWIASQAFSPITQIITTAEEISAHSLDRRIDYRGSADEVGQLAQTIDNMFDRLQGAFDRERRFIGDAAHELRTPLTALKGKIDVALSRSRQPDEYAQTIVEMREQVDRLIRLSNDLLFMARFDQQGQFKLDISPINLTDLFHAVVDQILPLAEQKQLTIAQDIAPSMLLHGDMSLLIRLFLNLLDNAIKYTPPGGTITISGTQTDRGLQIQVRDTGIGIPAEDLPYLFTRFYRVEEDRARHSTASGSGVGLSIADEIVQAHGGTITATSTLAPATLADNHDNASHGTTMTVLFPL